MAGDHGHHIIPVKTLISVFAGLILLTIITIISALAFDFGMLEMPIALAIAGTKATLVVMFFMALKYDEGVNSLVFTVGAVFVGIFIVFTLLDTAFRGDLPNVDPYTVQERERVEQEQREREPDPSLLRIAPGDFEGEDNGAEDPTEEQE